MRPLCAPGYLGRNRGEVIRTRTTVLQAHAHQWLGTFGHAGNGEYRAELRRAVAAIGRYVQAHPLKAERAVLRLDGQYGTGAVLSDLADLAYVMRGQDYHLLDQAKVQTRLHLPQTNTAHIRRAGFAAPIVLLQRVLISFARGTEPHTLVTRLYLLGLAGFARLDGLSWKSFRTSPSTCWQPESQANQAGERRGSSGQSSDTPSEMMQQARSIPGIRPLAHVYSSTWEGFLLECFRANTRVHHRLKRV